MEVKTDRDFLKKVITLSDKELLSLLEFYPFLTHEEDLKERLSQVSNNMKRSLYAPGHKRKGWERKAFAITYRFPSVLKLPQFDWLLGELILLLKKSRWFGYSPKKILKEYEINYRSERLMDPLLTYWYVKNLQSYKISKGHWILREEILSQEKAIKELAEMWAKSSTKNTTVTSHIRGIKRHLRKAKKLIEFLGFSEHKAEPLPEDILRAVLHSVEK